MSRLEYGIPPRPASGARQAASLLPYIAVILGLFLLSSAWAAILLYQVGMIGCLLVWSPRLRAGNVSPGRAAQVAVASALAGALPILVLWFPLGLDRVVPHALQELGLTGLSRLACFASLILIHPGLEELFWRGAMARSSPRPVTEDVIFAGYHAMVLVYFLSWPWVAVATAAIAVTAWMWRRTAAASGGLLLPVVSHMAADLGILGAVLFRLYGGS